MENAGLSLDHLAGSWRIYQLRRGHRFSLDDLLTAWTAAQAAPGAKRLLDLGAGIGSVGLLALWRMSGQARLTMVEVQPLSHRLAAKSVRENGLTARVALHCQDLRTWPGGEYDLITGSPPYLPLGDGTLPAHPQKAAARFELHGDVHDYCGAAARSLMPSGVFCFCHSASDPRPELAISAAGLVLRSRQEVFFGRYRTPSIALFVCGRTGERSDPLPLRIREGNGRWSHEYLAIREAMGALPDFLAAARRPSG